MPSPGIASARNAESDADHRHAPTQHEHLVVQIEAPEEIIQFQKDVVGELIALRTELNAVPFKLGDVVDRLQRLETFSSCGSKHGSDRSEASADGTFDFKRLETLAASVHELHNRSGLAGHQDLSDRLQRLESLAASYVQQSNNATKPRETHEKAEDAPEAKLVADSQANDKHSPDNSPKMKNSVDAAVKPDMKRQASDSALSAAVASDHQLRLQVDDRNEEMATLGQLRRLQDRVDIRIAKIEGTMKDRLEFVYNEMCGRMANVERMANLLPVEVVNGMPQGFLESISGTAPGPPRTFGSDHSPFSSKLASVIEMSKEATSIRRTAEEQVALASMPKHEQLAYDEIVIGKSAWDACVLIGFPDVDRKTSIVLLLASWLNVAVRVLFCIFALWSDVKMDIDDTILAAAASWRSSSTSLGTSSLLGTVCHGEEKLRYWPQPFDKFLRPENAVIEPLMTLSLLVWTWLVMGDIFLTLRFARGICMQPRGSPEMEAKAERLHIQSFVGFRIIPHAVELHGTLLSLLILVFFLYLHELVFASFLPGSTRIVLRQLAPLHVDCGSISGGVWLIIIQLFVVVVLAVLGCVVIAAAFSEKMDDVVENLCGAT